MIAEDVKITWVSADESIDQRDRPGFTPPECYGRGWGMERNEIGAITRRTRTPMAVELGMFVFQVTVLERIFIVEPE